MWKIKLYNIYFMINLLFILILLNQCSAEKTETDSILKYTAYPTYIEFFVEDKLLYELLDVNCTLPDTATFENDKLMKCVKLLPCTRYNVKSSIRNIVNDTILNIESQVTTGYAEPTVYLEQLNVSAHEISVPWTVLDNQNCVGKFRIILTSEDKDKKIDVTLGKYDYHNTFDNLSPCNLYQIELNIFNINGTLIEPSKYTNTKTMYEDPGSVGTLNFFNKSSTSVLVSWTTPNYTTCIDYYLIKWIKKSCVEKVYTDSVNDTEVILKKCDWDSFQITNSKTTEQIIGDLEGCETYLVSILTNGNENENNMQSGYFISNEQVPGEIDNVVFTSLGPTTVSFKWSKPKLNPNCVNLFVININGALQETIPSTNLIFTKPETFFIAKNLKPCGQYNFTFSSRSLSNRTNKPKSYMFTMDPDSPSEVMNPKIKRLYPKEFVLTWDNPLYGELCIDLYRIKGWSEKFPNNADHEFEDQVKPPENSLTRGKLHACMDYMVQIIGVSHGNPSMESKHLLYKITMLPTKKSKPKMVENWSKTYNSIKIEVTAVEDQNVCPVLYVRFKCLATSNATVMQAETVLEQRSDKKYETIISPLSPLTSYKCQASLYNRDGWSDNSEYQTFTTDVYYPDKPVFHEYTVTRTSISIEWLEPAYTNGMVKVYKVYLKQMEPKYKIYSHCLINKYDPKTIEVSATEYTFYYLLPYYQYSVQTAAVNEFGIGLFSEPIYITTDPDISDPVEDFAVSEVQLETNDTNYRANITFKWKVPCQTNGHVDYYLIKFYGVRTDFKDHKFEIKLNSLEVGNDGFIFYSQYHLRPEYNYTATISIAVVQVENFSSESEIKFVSPAGIPTRYNNSASNTIVEVNAFASNNPTTSALVKISSSALRSEMGKIEYAAILLSELDCQDPPQLKSDVFNSDDGWPNILTYYDANKNPCVLQYQTTPERWQPLNLKSVTLYKNELINSDDYNKNNLQTNNSENIQFIIGEQQCNNEGLYCNGPLKFNTKYKMVLRVFTRNGFNDILMAEFKTDSVIKLHVILSIVATILIFAFILGFVYLWINKKRLWYRQSQSGNIEDQSGDVSIKNFLNYYSDIAKKDKLTREFKELAVVENDANLCSYVTRYNETKNRYSNIFPYEKNRVILDNDADGSDYINASFINGYKRKKEYIATQGPKPETFIDFWKMVLQYNVKVIVMLTQFREGETIKCHQYYPMIPSREMKFGNNISVTAKRENITDLYEKRDMIVKHIGDEITHNVVHYFFKKWPDHDTPNDPYDLITFIKKVKSDKMSKRSPIIVHCSAGVGRAGTFIGLDIIIQRIKNEAKINIYETVKELRFQRMKMVQNIQQYQFLYRCSKELIKQKCKSSKKEVCDTQSLALNNNNNNSTANGTSQNSLKTNESCQSFAPNNIESVM